jgi:alpha-1,3-rhamnosyl/mannosyltransferase
MALALRAAQHVIAISEATRHDLLTCYSLVSKSVSVVPLAAAPTFAPVSPRAIAELCRRLDLPEQYVLYVGSNKPHKNLVLLVEAWAALQPASLPLVIAGVWDTRYPEAQQQAELMALGKTVRFLGPVAEADLPTLYTAALLFIFPSKYEGFGLPVLEAMACGTPVACSNTSCLPEVAGDAALMFDPTSVEAIADTIGCLLQDSDLRVELRERGLARAAQFSWQQTAQQTLYLYRQLAGR